MPRPKSATRAVSPFEQKFEQQQLYKRNKRYINMERANSLSNESTALRRKPLGAQDDHLSLKIQSSFMNSTAELTERRDKDIGKFKSRISLMSGNHSGAGESFLEPKSKQKQNDSSRQARSKSARSFSIQKTTSREYHFRLNNKPCADERRFNNFVEFKPNKPAACDFSLMRGKKLDNTIEFNDIQYDTQQLYQKYNYSNQASYCKVNYKSEKRQAKGRKFFDMKRPENLPATELDLEKVHNATTKASCFHTNGTAEFYRGSTKNLPSQFDMRFMNQLTNHWVDSQGNIPKKKLDYSIRKMKQDMTNERMEKINKSKQADINRQQVCDALFFRYHH